MTYRLHTLACLGGLLFFCLFAEALPAQVVNIEDQRSLQWDSAGVVGQADLGFSLVQNTRSVTSISASARFEKAWPRWHLLALQQFSLVSVNQDRFVNHGFAHLRLARKWTQQGLAWESFAQWQYNEKQLIRLRTLAGSGMRLRLSANDTHRANGGISLMAEYAEIKDTALIFRALRLNTYVSFSLRLYEGGLWSTTVYYQPALTVRRDWRISGQSALELTLTRVLTFIVRLQLSYDYRLEREVPRAPALIYSLQNGIRLRWGS